MGKRTTNVSWTNYPFKTFNIDFPTCQYVVPNEGVRGGISLMVVLANKCYDPNGAWVGEEPPREAGK